jgi:archaemetzincin
MKFGVLPVGQVNQNFLSKLCKELKDTFSDSTCSLIKETFPLSVKAFDKQLSQYDANFILNQIQLYAKQQNVFQRVLAVVDVDLFVSDLNFVFGEAYMPGKAALISLFRLKPEFYGEQPNEALFLKRALKEAVHELGHTLGLRHCPTLTCVMHFSNSITDTDKKQSLFCKQCSLQVAITIHNVG